MGLFQFAIIVFTSTTHAGFFGGKSAAVIFFEGKGGRESERGMFCCTISMLKLATEVQNNYF